MNTATYLSTLTGLTGTYPVKDMTVEIRVTDARNRFGGVDVLIEPVCGSGATWVAVESVALRQPERGSDGV